MTSLKKYLLQIKEWGLFSLLIFFGLLFIAETKYRLCVLDGISLWFFTVVPALFPYFFLSSMLSKAKPLNKIGLFLSPFTKKIFKTNGLCGYAFLISIISGYPIGSKTVSDLKLSGLISSVEAERSSVFCSTSSPAFLISLVGTVMANSLLFGVFLFLTHIFSAFLVGFIFSFYKPNNKESCSIQKSNLSVNSDNVLYESAYSSVISILIVGALITVFYLLTEILISLKILLPIQKLFSFLFSNEHIGLGLTLGILESTRGLKTLLSAPITLFTLPIASFICGFGGLSVIFQSIAYLKKAKIKTAPFLLGKLLTAFVNFIIGFIFSILLFR